MTETILMDDVIDQLVGIAPGSHLDHLRAQRPQARDNAEASYHALFHPDDASQMSVAERHQLAVFVAGLHRQPDIADFYAASLPAADATHMRAAATHAATIGPYGRFPTGPLTAEDTPGPSLHLDGDARTVLGRRLAAALEHAHMLVYHPRDAAPPALQALLDAGWSATGIVTLSQLVAFLSFQIRVVAGLRALAAAPDK